MNSTNDSLDLRVIHDQIHNLVLARRRGVAFWEGPFETAWAGYVLAQHAPENTQLEIVNSIKGEILGERRIKEISKPYDLAACYMIAAFLHSVNVEDASTDYIKAAESFASGLSEIEWKERFHFYSTPEYVYAGSLIYGWAPDQLLETSIANLRRATEEFRSNQWYGRSQIYALAGSAYLRLNSFRPDNAMSLIEYALQFQPPTPEDSIAILWFLETNWEQTRRAIPNNPNFADRVDSYLIELRTRVMRFFPNFVTESFDLEESHSYTASEQHEQVASARIVSTIELLMLDEITERHTASAIVVTREEWERRDVATTVFDQYRKQVDTALELIGLSGKLKVVYDSLSSDNPASWSQAALGCRQILYELSDLLLQVPDKSYPYILDHTGTSPMSLANDKEKNRLQAYMHQIGIRSQNPLVGKQLEYLMNLLRQLIDDTAAEGKRKPAPEYEQVRSLVLHTYLFLGELERLTKFQVVKEIKSS